MDSWHSNLSESPSGFSMSKNANITILTNWLNTSSPGELKHGEIELGKGPVHRVGPMPFSCVPEIPPYKMSENNASGVIAKCKKFRSGEQENSDQQLLSWSEKSRKYKVLLSEMRKMETCLASMHGEKEDLANQIKGLSELLKSVIAELEQNLTQGSFLSNGFEDSFWVSVQTMARRFRFDFLEFANLLATFCSLDGDIPQLEDHGPENAPISFVKSSKKSAQELKQITLSHLVDSCALSAIVPYTSPKFSDVCSTPFNIPAEKGVLQPFPPEPATLKANSRIGHLDFGASTILDIQDNLAPSLGFNDFNEGCLSAPICAQQNRYDNFSYCNPSSKHESVQALAKFDQDPWKRTSMNNIGPYLHPNEHTIRGTCKRRMQRQRRRSMNLGHSFTMVGASPRPLACCPEWGSPSKVQNKCSERNLQFLLQKQLRPSDVGNLGRIILPKRQAEEHLPHLDAKEGLTLAFEDLHTSCIWNLRFRFWPNNKTRMYLLESTGNFVKYHHLQEGDFIELYKNSATGKYIISGKKARSLRHSSKALKRNPQQGLSSSGQDECGLHFPLNPEKTMRDLAMVNTSNNDSCTFFNDVNERQTDLLVCSVPAIKHLDITEETFKDLEEEEMIQEFSSFEADNRSIDEIFDFDK